MAEQSFANYSVLVIDDETFTRTVLARMLGGLGFKAVFQAEDGQSGITAVRDFDPDVVVCDVQMKPMDGLGFLRALRHNGVSGARGIAPEVVFMTNRLDAEMQQEAQSLGSNQVLLKPVTPGQLKTALAGCLPGT